MNSKDWKCNTFTALLDCIKGAGGGNNRKKMWAATSVTSANLLQVDNLLGIYYVVSGLIEEFGGGDLPTPQSSGGPAGSASAVPAK